VVGWLEVDPGPGRTLAAADAGFVDALTSVLCMAAEQGALHERLHHEAHHDALTGLPNRALLEDRLAQAIARAHRDGTMVAVLFIDLDRFKYVNDTLGHQAGNEVLVQIAERLSGRVRESDTVARLGGDEFVLVHGGLKGPDDAHAVARAIVNALGQPFHVAGHTVKVRATVGVSTYPYDGTEIETLISKADRAMYYGKRGGRNSVQFFTDAMNEFSTAQLEMEHDLQSALAAGDLELHFQPQLSPHTNELRGFEALARWKHPRHGWIPPTRFVPVAEEMGLIVELGAWALHEACHQAARWTHASGRGVRVSVNISPNHFARTDFFDSVEAALHSSGLPANQLELEVTESIMMHDIATVTRVLAALRRRGVQIALDDFGLGYSSVSYLRILPLDRIKIDKSFLDADDDQPNAGHDQLSVLSAVATMAQALGLRVTLEGIETPHHLRMARAVGCDEVQGHLFGHPVPGGKVAEMLVRWPQRAHRR
jgi:diguanylate cyclase (GGDEF)-like protein